MKLSLSLSLAVVSTLIVSPLEAQTYPNRPIKIIVPAPAGSVTDVIFRAAGDRLSSRLGKFIIENRPGANFIIAAQACADAPPDGYTLCAVGNSSLSLNPLIYPNLPYNASADFTVIGRLYFLIEGFAVNAALPVSNVAELRDLAVRQPEVVNFGTSGPASYPDLFRHWLNREWGSNIIGVPYTGGGPMAVDLAAGHLKATWLGLGNFISQATGKDRRIKILAVSTAERWVVLPDVPTYKEAGMNEFPGRAWWGLAAPKGMPQEIVTRLNHEFSRLFEETEFVAFLSQQAAQPAVGSPGEFARFLTIDRENAKLLVEIGNVPKL